MTDSSEAEGEGMFPKSVGERLAATRLAAKVDLEDVSARTRIPLRHLEAMALIGLGIERLSITPVAIGPIKAMLRSLDRAALAPFLQQLLDHPPKDMRAALHGWAVENGVEIG